jgi:hypothetical protein
MFIGHPPRLRVANYQITGDWSDLSKEKQSRRDRAGFGRRLAVYDRALAVAAGWWRSH